MRPSLTASRIETQDVLLKQQRIQRLIEIGPANTLTSMMKKTLTSHYQLSDAASSTKRTLFSYARDAAKIHYEVDSAPARKKRTQPVPAAAPAKKNEATKSKQQPAQAASVAKEAVNLQIMTPQPPIVVQERSPVLELPDAAVEAEDIVIAIIAPKLKKGFAEIERTKSIKQLTGGMSLLFFSLE